jgi:tetratricopeptide (TPR) repeat protein
MQGEAGIPAGLAAERRGVFVGRDGELAMLQQIWNDVASGGSRRRFALVLGEPGVGKTRLVAELASSVADAGAVVLAGRADDGLTLPFQPFAEALQAHVAASAPADAARRIAGAGDEIGWLIPGIATSPATATDPESGRFRLFEALTAYVAAVAAERAVLLVIDDLQWADRGSALMLRHVLRSGVGPLLVVATARDDAPSPGDYRDVLVDLWSEPGTQRVALRGLGVDDVVALVAAAEVDGDVGAIGQHVHQLTDGNSFFVREVIRNLAEGQDTLPASVLDVVRRRVWRLPEATGNVLTVAAVVGREFDLRVAARVADVGEDDALGALEQAIGARLVHEAGDVDRFSFDHALVQEALLADVTATRRSRLHARAAEAWEDIGDPADPTVIAEIAHHLCASGDPSVAVRAVEASRAAAAAHSTRFAFDEAARTLVGALDVFDAAPRSQFDDAAATRLALTLELATALEGAGDAPAARRRYVDAVEQARASHDGTALAAGALGATSDGVTSGEVDPAAVALLEEGLRALPRDEVVLRVNLHAALARELLFTGSGRSVDVAEVGVAVAREAGEPTLLARALGGLHQALIGPGRPEERLVIADEIVALADASGDPSERRWARSYRVIDRLQLLDLAGAADDVAAHTAAAREMRPPSMEYWAEALEAMLAIARGAYDAAETHMQRAYELGNLWHGQNVFGTYATQLFQLRWLQGRLQELAPLAAANADDPATRTVAWTVSSAVVAAETDAIDVARRLLDRVRGTLGTLPHDNLRIATIAQAAVVAQRCTDPAVGAEAVAALEAHRGQGVVIAVATAFLGAIETYIGLGLIATGRVDEGIDTLEEGLNRNERAGAVAAYNFAARELRAALTRRGRTGDVERIQALVPPTNKPIGASPW